MQEIHQGLRQNAKAWGRNFSARLIEPGLVSYEDCGGGKELLRPETISRCAQSFVGKPLVIRHQEVSPSNQDRVAVGHISRVWNDNSDGWWYCEGVVFKDEAMDLIKGGWMVSSAYRVKGAAAGGLHHGIAYVSETTDFEGEHLALVENPRYEGASIRLNSKNNKPDSTMNLFKWFKKKDAPETAKELSGDTTIDVNGSAVRLNDLVAEYKADKEKRDNAITPESLVEIDGEMVPVSVLIEARLNAKKEEPKAENALVEDKGGRIGLKKVKKKKENEADEEVDDDSEEPKKENSFKQLSAAKETAHVRQDGSVQFLGTISEQCDLGKSRYGSDPVK